MRGIAVMDIRHSLESPSQALADSGLADEAAAPRIAAAGHLHHRILGEVAHDAVDVVCVEGVSELMERVEDGPSCGSAGWHCGLRSSGRKRNVTSFGSLEIPT